MLFMADWGGMRSANKKIQIYKFAQLMLCWARENIYIVHSIERISAPLCLFKQIENKAI